MDLLQQVSSSQGGSRKDAELAKAMFEGTQQYRRKLKMPEMNAFAEAVKEEAEGLSFFEFFENPIGRFYFCRFVQDVHPVHGNVLLQIGRYQTSVHEKRRIAQELLDAFVAAVTEIWSGEDADVILDAWRRGQKATGNKAGNISGRQNAKAGKLQEAKRCVKDFAARLSKGTSPDLCDDMFALLKDDLEDYFAAFKSSKYMDMHARARSMERQTVGEDEFHQLRVLGVGGFGSVCAAVKKDTGALLVIKRMDKKLIKHKNRYKSCFTEVIALKSMSSAFVCGLHYTYQTKDHVCLVLDLLHGGTLSYLLHQHKKVSERYVSFFTACIVMAYQALHEKSFVYRDMKPANVLIKDNGTVCW